MRINVGEMNAAILEYERHFPDDLIHSIHSGSGQHRYVFQSRVIVGRATAYWYMVGRVEGIKAAQD